MGSTTIHFPEEILSRIDQAAAERRISRNRYVLEACEAALASQAGVWPEGFFNSGLTEKDHVLLKEAAAEMEQVIYKNRRNRGAPLL
jgi:predicted transcriptional regulator